MILISLALSSFLLAAAAASPVAAASASAAASSSDDSKEDSSVSKKKSAASEFKVHDEREHMNVVFIGHVDAGKSTTCGNILYVSRMIYISFSDPLYCH